MIPKHCSTAEQRVQWVSELLARPTQRGLLSQRSRNSRVSRQTLYRWEAKGAEALQAALSPSRPVGKSAPVIERAVLTLLVEGHASYRGIQACLKELLGVEVSLGTIVSIVQQAGSRAQACLAQQRPEIACALALDEQYSSKRGAAYLNVVDAHSSVVWASMPPVAVDGESWTILLWYLHEQGIEWESTVSDGGRAIQEALTMLKASATHQRDVWHLLHLASQVQGRVDRSLDKLQGQLATVVRQAERIATGQKARGAHPATDVQAQTELITQTGRVAEGLRYLFGELCRLCEVVVLTDKQTQGIMTSQFRHQELQTLLELVDEVEYQAPAALQREIHTVSKQLRIALPHLLLFTRALDALQEQAVAQLGASAVHLIAWAWQRRQILGADSEKLVKGFPPAWQEIASKLLHAWSQAVRASSAVENWHSIVRPHLAVHRTLSAGLLARLSVWHNYQVAPRGLHMGMSPLQRSGIIHQETDWLLVLGYVPLVA